MVGEDAFYLCYAVGSNFGWGYDWVDHMVLIKLDTNLNVLWRRYWNKYQPEYGMKVYWPHSITTTSDGGCLITGECFHSDRSNPAVFILKFFSDGSLSIPEAEAFVRPYMFYPNPAQGQCTVQFERETPSVVRLFTIEGVLVQEIIPTRESIELTLPASGVYLLVCDMKEGTVVRKVVSR